MPKHDEKYTLFFAAVITIVCSVILASAATLLKAKQAENVALDKRKNILVAFGFDASEKTKEEINALFDSRVEPRAINDAGEEIKNLNPSEIEKLDAEAEYKNPDAAARKHPLFILKDTEGQIEAFGIPLFGKGLWSTLYGYLALEKNGNDVRGITYYKHGETPGLGAEVENPSWQAQFKQDKKIYENGELKSLHVAKGKDTSQDTYAVSSISGATITSKGVERMLKENLETYDVYLRSHAR